MDSPQAHDKGSQRQEPARAEGGYSAAAGGSGALDATLELRVQGGPQAGARSALPLLARGESWQLHIGRQPIVQAGSHDLMLHGASSARLRVTPSTDNKQLRLELLDGTASLNGRPLEPASPLAWPMYRSLRVGDVSVVYGSSLVPVWQEAPSDADGADEERGASSHGNLNGHHGHAGPKNTKRADADPATHPDQVETKVAASKGDTQEAKVQSHRWMQRLALVGVGCLLGSVLVVGLLKVLGPRPNDLDLAKQALATKAFKHLTVRTDAAGVLQVAGTLTSEAQQAELQDLLKRAGIQATLDVRVPGLTEQLKQFFVGLGITETRIENHGGGVVEVWTKTERLATREMQDETTIEAKREVSGLTQLTIHNDTPKTVAGLSCGKSADDPGKRPTSVVWDAKSPTLNTADGSKFQVGSLLPTGHRLKAIDKDRTVTLDCDGQISQLRL